MEIAFWEAITAIATVVTAIGGAIVASKKSSKKDKKAESNRILEEAKEELTTVRKDLEMKIKLVEIDLKNLKHDIAKDIEFIKETQASEIKVLGEKIQNLRDELRAQHADLVGLLSKLIENK
jgi:hypothetical protein